MYVSIAHKVCCEWRDVALTICDRLFMEDEEQLIDIHDVKVTSFLMFFAQSHSAEALFLYNFITTCTSSYRISHIGNCILKNSCLPAYMYDFS